MFDVAHWTQVASGNTSIRCQQQAQISTEYLSKVEVRFLSCIFSSRHAGNATALHASGFSIGLALPTAVQELPDGPIWFQ